MDFIRSPPGLSLFREHKVLLSYDSDKYINVSQTWSFQQFKNEVKDLFPKLKDDFRLIDADFREMEETSFNTLKTSPSGETWLLVCDNNNESQEEKVLDRPCYELLKYDVHPNALTQSGNYHFSCMTCYQAFCEFIDNSVQATNQNTDKRIIKLHVFEDWNIACIFDNGNGMTSEGMKAFASYFLSQDDRGLEKGPSETFGYLDGNISKFGVGATQAAFYLGGTIKVITKKKDSKFVTEISISKEKLHERAKKNMPVFEDYRCIRNPGDTTTLDDSELCLKELIFSEKSYPQFTYVVIEGLHEKHLSYISNNDGQDLARNLAHVYHYYLHGAHGKYKKLVFDRISLNNFEESQKKPVKISIVLYPRRGSPTETFLHEVDDDLESLYQKNAKSVFPFSLELSGSENSPGKHIVQGCLLYFPNDQGEETLPKLKSLDEENNQPNPCFECFWQGRLAPLSYVNKLDFCSRPENRSRKQRDIMPDACFYRIRGLLFFNRNTPVSNNKLKILLDTNLDLSDALSSASTSRRNLPQAFRQWLEECHRNFDKEIIFMNMLSQNKQPNNGDLFYESLKITSSGDHVVYTKGDIVRIDTRPVAYGKILYFINKGKANEPGTVIYSKLPEDVYGDSTEERPVMRLAGKPEKSTLTKYIAGEMIQMPKTIKIFEGEDRITQVPSKLEFLTGEGMKAKTNFWVAIYSGEKPSKIITDLHQQKLSVRVEITGRNPLVNNNPVGRYYGFKPFFLDKMGVYTMKFSVLIGNVQCGVEKELKILMEPNVAEIVNLLDNSPNTVPLGEKCIEFTLSFHDIYQNPTTMFKDDQKSVKLQCSVKNLEIHGLEGEYKPDNNGILKVSGLSLFPTAHQINLSNEYEFWIDVLGIGDVMFAVKLITGPPSKVKMTKLTTREFMNYNNFPEIDVKVLDKHDQPAIISKNDVKLGLICDAFVSPVLTSSISNGKAKFPATGIKIENLREELTQDVRISLIIPETRKRKIYVGKVLSELLKFEITIIPSDICKSIRIVKEVESQNHDNAAVVSNDDGNIIKNHNNSSSKCGLNNSNNNNNTLNLEALAGSEVKGLKIIGYTEGGRKLSDEELLSQDLHVTTTWAEVNLQNLPKIPDCPVTNIIQVNVQNVQCFCKYNGFEIRNEAKLRISVCSGPPKKWSFQPLTLTVISGKEKELSEAVKIIALDQYHNPTATDHQILPIVNVQHSKGEGHVEYTGSVVFKKSAFFFTPESTLFGTVGEVTLKVQDENQLLTKDTISVQLTSGEPVKLRVTSKAFERGNKSDEGARPKLHIYTCSAIPYAITCVVVDACGNPVNIKTQLAIDWSDASMGKRLSRATNNSGEAVFPTNSIRCGDSTGEAQLQIHAPEIKNIQPFIIDVQLLQCNRVTKINPVIEKKKFHAASSFPTISISHETEDQVPVPNFLANLAVEFKKPSGNYFHLLNVYPPLERSSENNVIILKARPDEVFEESGEWIVSCKYTETRPEIKQLGSTVVIGSCKLQVTPAPVAKFCLSIPDSVTLFGSSTEGVQGRTLIPLPQPSNSRKNSMLPPIVSLNAVDEFGNKCPFHGDISLTIEPVDEKLLGPDDVLPALEDDCCALKMKDGFADVKKVILQKNVGNKIGMYYLKFSDGVHKHCRIQFSFTTSEELERITQELEPLRNELSSLGMTLKDKQNAFAKAKNITKGVFQTVSSFFTQQNPDIQDIDLQVAKIRNETYDFETREKNLRRAIKDRNYPPNSVRQYIKGLVCELAYASDPNICRILSWFAQSKMKVALCETKEQQRKVYDLGYPAYSETLLTGFQRGRDENGLLRLDLPRPPDGFRSPIHFAVNLLEFTPNNLKLRGTLFYSVFSNTIVLSDLDHAQRYREHLLKANHRCPAILTMNGDLIASDGLMDPNRKCPPRLDNLRFTFGELPYTERAEYHSKLEHIQKLDKLRQATFEMNLISQEVKQCEKDLAERKHLLQPRINILEEHLKDVKAKTVKNKSGEILTPTPPPPKRKRK